MDNHESSTSERRGWRFCTFGSSCKGLEISLYSEKQLNAHAGYRGLSGRSVWLCSVTHYVINGTIFEKMTEHKMWVVIMLSTTFVWNISRCEKNWARCDENVYRSSCKVASVWSDCNQIWNFSTDFRKILISNWMKILLVRAELFRADGRTNIHDEADSRFSQFWERA